MTGEGFVSGYSGSRDRNLNPNRRRPTGTSPRVMYLILGYLWFKVYRVWVFRVVQVWDKFMIAGHLDP